jgi:hypothetical protein
LGYTLTAKKADNQMDIGFLGSDARATIYGSRPRTNSFQTGVGLKISTESLLDGFINYDFDVNNNYSSHSASVGLGLEF